MQYLLPIPLLKPHAMIRSGKSGEGATKLPKEILEEMAKLNDKPIIFSLSNPTANSECSAEAAYVASNGRAIYASGSPYAPVELNGKTLVPGQGNNMYIFPGLGFGAWLCQSTKVSTRMITIAAMTLADMASQDDLAAGCMYPKLTRIREISAAIATKVIEQAFDEGLASISRPDNILQFVKDSMWEAKY